MKKRIISLLLALCLLAGAVPAALAADKTAVTFTDVPAGSEYADAAAYVAGRGLMTGTSAGRFSPDGTLTRAAFVTILWRLEGKPVVNYRMSFTDVADDAWYAEAVRWAASESIASGFDKTSFRPDAALTREQLAVLLCRYTEKKGLATDIAMGTAGYEDVGKISEYAYSSVAWAISSRIMENRDGLIQPRAAATRGETAAILQRFLTGEGKSL